ncbi:MAG: FYVE zinc finger domain-containing protein [Thermoplasmata archaeon]|nr:FYVE zinc finger domain-containing protein [Thermoplasmata archaeon]
MSTASRLPGIPLRLNLVELRTGFQNGFPLLLLGGLAMAMAFVVLPASQWAHSTRLPVALLAFTIGVVALAGGLTALVAGDFGPATRDPDPPTSSPPWPREGVPEPVSDPADGELIVSRRAWERLNAMARGGAPWDEPTAPSPPGPTVGQSAPTPRWAAPPSRNQLSEGSSAKLDAVTSELERELESLDEKRKIGLDWSRPTASSSGSPVSRPTVGKKETRAKDGTPAARSGAARGGAGIGSSAEPMPREATDEMNTLLKQFYPDLPATGRAAGTAGPISAPRAFCEGCGRRLGVGPDRLPCFRCGRPMCGSCASRARVAKRTLLCRTCCAEHGIPFPDS